MASVVSLFKVLWAWRDWIVPMVLVLTIFGLAGRCHYLASMLDLRERLLAASVAREQEMSAKLVEAARALNQAKGANHALVELAEACMEREANARADFAARTAIMSNAKPRPRTNAETKEVVDDATRHAAAARLNRSW